MPSNHLILCHSLLLLPSIFPSIRVFSDESILRISWPKYWSFSFSISPSDEYSGLISFRMDWLDLLGVQGTLKSLLQHHSSKASILQCSAFFMVQLWHPYMTSGKTIALTRQTFVSKVMSLLFNMLSRLVLAFLPRSKCLLISWLQSPSVVILEPPKIKSLTFSIASPSICHEVMGPDAMILMFINGWVNKQNVISTYNGVLFGLKRGRKLWSLATTWINLEDLLSEISQSQKDKYCMIPLMWDAQSSEIHRERSKWWLPGAGGKERGRGSYEWDRALVLQDEKSYGGGWW